MIPVIWSTKKVQTSRQGVLLIKSGDWELNLGYAVKQKQIIPLIYSELSEFLKMLTCLSVVNWYLNFIIRLWVNGDLCNICAIKPMLQD